MLVYISLALSLVGLYCKALVPAVNFNCRPLITSTNELGLVMSIAVLCCIWPFGLFLWRLRPFSRPVVALKGERRLVEAVI